LPEPCKIAILGGKGGGTIAAQTVLNLARTSGSHALAGYLNDGMPVGSELHGGRVLCGFDDWPRLDPAIQFVAPLHNAGRVQRNVTRIVGLGIPAARWVRLIDPLAIVADGAGIGHGSVVSALAHLSPDSAVGAHCFLRAGAIVSHDVVLGDFVYVGFHATICGYARIERGAHIAPGAILRDSVTVGEFAVVGLGAVVTKDVPAYSVVAGNPAQVIQTIERNELPL
jgi:acetyltransferase EpsM